MAKRRDNSEGGMPPVPRRGFWRPALPWIVVVLAVVLGFAWSQRNEIADDIIASELEKRGIEASYKVERIGGRRQVLRDLVLGDPERPDATVERAEVRIGWTMLGPAVRWVTLERARLSGTLRDGELSFGALDPLLFAEDEPDRPPSLPDLDVTIVDGRARIASEYGVLGLVLEGSGNPSDGFEGQLGALMPDPRYAGCEATRASFYGTVTTNDSRPTFDGPLRLRDLACEDRQIALAALDSELELTLPATFDAAEGELAIETGAGRYGAFAAQALEGSARFDFKPGEATLDYDLALLGLDTPEATLARLSSDGVVRLRDDFARLEWSGGFDGRNLRPGESFNRALAAIGSGANDTPFAPLAAKLRAALSRQTLGSSLEGNLTLRRGEGTLSLVIPAATLRNRNGVRLAELSRLRWSNAEGGNLGGSFRTGGPDLPRMTGSLTSAAGGSAVWQLSLEEYAARSSRIAAPDLRIVQSPDGRFDLTGDVRLSGPLPGGFARNLAFPLDAVFEKDGSFRAFTRCTPVRFDRFEYANLRLARHAVTLCPPTGRAIVRGGNGPLRIVAGAPSLDLAGTLAGTPIDIRSGPIAIAYPGIVRASELSVHLGPPDSGADFVLSDLDAELGGKEISGTFADTEARLVAVPLDVSNAAGEWRYANGVLSLSGATFLLADRNDPQRFYPLDATEAALTLEDGDIRAEANLRDRDTQRLVAAVEVFHDLASGSGNATLDTDALRFDAAFQPEDLTYLAKGTIANTRGLVSGQGRIRWADGTIDSGGEYFSADLDFAAPFGPVEGASGTLVFTDLLAFETAPSQTFQVRSINPGIEVNDGEITLALRRGFEIGIEGGRWPFMGGTLTLRPTDVRFGEGEVRRFTLVVDGLQASRFIERFELANLSATGTFDGRLPLVFDDSGGRIEGGVLVSRPPGGNLSYVGELTYRDLSTMANLAFNVLKSLDYAQMRINMDGDLTGNIVTRVRTFGVRQGEAAERNIVTRSLEGLPIQLNLNINARFYELIALLKSIYDPTALRDARSLGLIDDQGNIIAREVRNPPPPDVDPFEDEIDDIQPSESEEQP